MAAGVAQRIYDADPSRGPVVIAAPGGKRRWHPLWAGNPVIYAEEHAPSATTPVVTFGGDELPYLPRPGAPGPDRWPNWRLRDHRPRLYLTDGERALGTGVRAEVGPFLLLEPTGRDRKSPNRAWPLAQWQALVSLLRAALPQYALVQLDRPDADRLTNIRHIPHDSFRAACGILQSATLLVSTEGGLQVAAGTLRVPAVILLSPCGPPADVIGFPEHLHIVDADPRTPCGYLTRCDHCAAAWARLTPAHVAEAIVRSVGD